MTIKSYLNRYPTPVAGLALAIASLGWSWENLIHSGGIAQWSSAVIAGILLLPLLFKWLMNIDLWQQELAHPVIGSVMPTMTMTLMVVANSLAHFVPWAGHLLWLLAVIGHFLLCLIFVYKQARIFKFEHLIPSWFVPPVGIIVADVAFTGYPPLLPTANFALNFGLISYALLLPVMLYRLIFCAPIADAAKPAIAILAAPASLSLAGYLTVTLHPSWMLVTVLLSIALLMTLSIYVVFIHLLRLPFSPSFSALTFPLVIGATALFKVSFGGQSLEALSQYSKHVYVLAVVELMVASLIVAYVAFQYIVFTYNAIQRVKAVSLR